MTAAATWRPPFIGRDDNDLTCPKCGEHSVRVREHETYFDGDTVEAYCADCHTLLEVCAFVNVEFSEPETLDEEPESTT